jgi:hypothetical protein
MDAEQIYDVLTKRTFENFYKGPFIEHITEMDHNPPDKAYILKRITELFNLPPRPYKVSTANKNDYIEAMSNNMG